MEEKNQPFGRMLLTGEPLGQTFLLDLLLTPDFVGRGFSVGWTADPRQEPLRQVETVMSRAAWDALENAVSEVELPTEGRYFRLTDYAELETILRGVTSEMWLVMTRPDPRLRVWRGQIDVPYWKEQTDFGRYNFLLEEFESPDPLTAVLATMILLIGGAVVSDWLQSRSTERATKICGGEEKAESIKVSTKLSVLKGEVETTYEVKCKGQESGVKVEDIHSS